MWVFSLSFLPPLSYSSSLDPRQTEGAPLHWGTSPRSLPAVLMVGLWGTGYKGGKEAKMERKGFDLFYLTASNWIQELWGTGVKINSSWSALMARRRAKTASEQGAHWHHVLVYFLFSSKKKKACISAFCVLFLAGSKMGMVKECSFSPRVPLAGFIAL